MELNKISGLIVDSALKVHTVLGPGLLERPYADCLAHELRERGCEVAREVAVPVLYEGVRVAVGYRIDLLVNESVVVEVKAVAKLLPIHEAALLSQLKLGNFRMGLLLNFHERHLKDGIKRLVNNL